VVVTREGAGVVALMVLALVVFVLTAVYVRGQAPDVYRYLLP